MHHIPIGEPQYANVVGDGGADHVGVYGNTVNATGVWGHSANGNGTYGASETNNGVMGQSDGAQASGVYGQNTSTGFGVAGRSAGGVGVLGDSQSGRGVAGFSNMWQGVYGHSGTQAGVVGESDNHDGVYGISHSPQRAGVSGHNPGGLAGFFEGDVIITGDIQGDVRVTGDIFLTNKDAAEQFLVSEAEAVDAGTVMVLDTGESLRPSELAYDKRVAGVISGAGACAPGLVLGAKVADQPHAPLALIGRVYCKVDANYASIEVGDLLTTSSTPGHAMKALDATRAFGAVIGKALARLEAGLGMIPILVALQ